MTARFRKGTFRLLHRGVWEMFPKLGDFTPQEALVFLYLESGPRSHYTGLYNVSMTDIACHTRLPRKDVQQAIEGLSRRGLIVYDDERQMVFVHKMLHRQLGTEEPYEKNLLGIIHYLERMPDNSPAIKAFVAAHRKTPEIQELFDGLYGGAIPGSDGGGDPTRYERPETGDLKRETRNEKSDTVIAQKDSATTCASNLSKTSTDEDKGKVNGKPASKGMPDDVADILKALPDGKRVAIENRWKEIQAGKVSRPQVREEMKKVGWFNDAQIARLIPERGAPDDWLSEVPE